MSLFAIGDTHLSFGVEKPMDVFGGWQDYESRLAENWRSIVKEDDTNCCHVVKGSSKQRTDHKQEVMAYDDNGEPSRIKRTESVYSSTNVNIVLPSGKFVELH